MADQFTGADALMLMYDGDAVRVLRHVGEPDGVYFREPSIDTDIAGANRPGIGELKCTGNPKTFSWKAPGSARFGRPVVQAGNYPVIALDGEDHNKWVRIFTQTAYAIAGQSSRVYLVDTFNNAFGYDDVTAAQAVSGNTATWTIVMYNVGTAPLYQLKAWIEPGTTRLTISDDGATWVAPYYESDALEFPDLAPDDTDILHLRRVIPKNTPYDPKVLNVVNIGFQSL